ncbi:hypothetical protein [Streptomyces sp. NBC_00455]|uniref:hypothetical protein n=1 Tax=Streptomyces sp. NBC_00455 TaxID=2903654 RepID=UPI002E1F882C
MLIFRDPGVRRENLPRITVLSVLLSLPVAVVVPKDFKCSHWLSVPVGALLYFRSIPDVVIIAAT